MNERQQEAVVAHLTAITENSASLGVFEFRSISHKTDKVRRRFADNVNGALFDWIEEEQGREGNRMFVGVCERSGTHRDVVLNSSLFFVDIDGTGQDASVEDLDNVLAISEGMGWDPMRIIHSGGGFHIYYEAKSTMSPGERRATAQAMAREFASDPRCPGRPDPAVCDAARMAGLWGTLNGKYESSPEVSVLYEGSSTPVSVLVPMERVRRGLTKIPKFEEGMNSKVYSLRLLLPITQEFPSAEVLEIAAGVVNANLPDSASGACAEALKECMSALSSDKGLRVPRKGGRRMWAYAKLASLVEAFPDSAVLHRAAEVIKGCLPGWVAEEPGQVESIVESLERDRLC